MLRKEDLNQKELQKSIKVHKNLLKFKFPTKKNPGKSRYFLHQTNENSFFFAVNSINC